MVTVVTPKVGNRVRVFIHHADEWRPLVWLRVGRDGSIYAGLLTGRPSSTLQLSKHVPSGEKETKLSYSEGHELSPDEVPASSRVSFKASGEVHLGHKRVRGVCLETLKDPNQLCIMNFVHPARYKPQGAPAPNEYDVRADNYPVDDSCPMYGTLIAARWDGQPQVAPIRLPKMTAWLNIALGFRALTRTPDLLLQLVIGHGPKGTWLERPGLGVWENA